MKTTELACYFLLASAFLLGGLLLSSIGGSLEQQAEAEMVINRQNFTVMTTHTRDDEECVFVLNNVSSRLLVYRLNVARNELELVGNEDMAAAFNLGGGVAPADPGRSRRPR